MSKTDDFEKFVTNNSNNSNFFLKPRKITSGGIVVVLLLSIPIIMYVHNYYKNYTKESLTKTIWASVNNNFKKENIDCKLSDLALIEIGKNQYKGMAKVGNNMKVEIEITSDDNQTMWKISGEDMLKIRYECSSSKNADVSSDNGGSNTEHSPPEETPNKNDYYSLNELLNYIQIGDSIWHNNLEYVEDSENSYFKLTTIDSTIEIKFIGDSLNIESIHATQYISKNLEIEIRNTAIMTRLFLNIMRNDTASEQLIIARKHIFENPGKEYVKEIMNGVVLFEEYDSNAIKMGFLLELHHSLDRFLVKDSKVN